MSTVNTMNTMNTMSSTTAETIPDPLRTCPQWVCWRLPPRSDGRTAKIPCQPHGSADHLGRLEEEGRRDGQAQGLRGLQVDDQLERGGLPCAAPRQRRTPSASDSSQAHARTSHREGAHV
jgi:hypothetical protein